MKRKKRKKFSFVGSGTTLAASAVGLSVGSHVVGAVSAGTPVAATANRGLTTLSSFQSPMASVVGGGMVLGHLGEMVPKKKKETEEKIKW
tara:strand:+ start:777 stop:1046 length:270 start_codon:yes stop_codon:yes gene_type:complete